MFSSPVHLHSLALTFNENYNMMSRVSARQDMKIQKLHKIKCKKRSNLVQSGKPFWNVTINSYDNICITHLQML